MFYCTQYTTIPFVGPIIAKVTPCLLEHAPDFSPIANNYHITLSAIEENGQISPTKFKVALRSTVGVQPYKIPPNPPGVKDRAVESQELKDAGLGSCCDYQITAGFIVDLATPNPTASVTHCVIQ